jgi:hypothetical protein
MYEIPVASSPQSAFESLAESRYGFSLVDLNLSQEDLKQFNLVEIEKSQDFNQIGDLAHLQENIVIFLQDIGNKDLIFLQKTTEQICQIVATLLETSQRETGWVCLRAFLPTEDRTQRRWHFDGGYYRPKIPNALLCKWIVTLKGPSTLFYCSPRDNRQERHTLWMSTWNPTLMASLCLEEQIFTPQRGQGALFIAASEKNGALHAEPPIHEPRLMLSFVPCFETEIPYLKQRIQDYFKNQNVQ